MADLRPRRHVKPPERLAAQEPLRDQRSPQSRQQAKRAELSRTEAISKLHGRFTVIALVSRPLDRSTKNSSADCEAGNTNLNRICFIKMTVTGRQAALDKAALEQAAED